MIPKAFNIIRLLGPSWAAKRTLYAIKRKIRWFEIQNPCGDWSRRAPEIKGQFFAASKKYFASSVSIRNNAESVNYGLFRFFCHKTVQCQFPPDWFGNPFNGSNPNSETLQHCHWSKITDFGQGDIKCIWELSRFSWVFLLVRAYQEDPNEIYSDLFWQLIDDWADHNPPNTGVHWKCGQEIAVRMIALVVGYFSFRDTVAATHSRKNLLAKIIFESARRIEANIGYALNQQNNHGTSEAAGLFTAGVVFGRVNWIKKGSKLLEDQVQKLVYEDGSFSQHSANYHRVMLHACLWAIQLGRANGLDFSEEFIMKVRKAGNWLLALYDPQSGCMPNLGSNDGALILPYSSCDYKDFRPTIQAMGAVIDGKRWLPAGEWDDLALWLVPGFGGGDNAKTKVQVEAMSSYAVSSTLHANKLQLNVLHHGGYAVFNHKNTKLIFRCPVRFYHRPAQCDLLHVDLWKGGINVLRDAGTYSYNCKQPWQDYFKSVAAHNTVQFDDHDQMPKISRFLYGKWPRLNAKVSGKGPEPYAEAVFTDWKGCRHKRRVEMAGDTIRVTDTISGYSKTAVLRWRLAPGFDWYLSGTICSGGPCHIHLRTDNGFRSLKITKGWESIYYRHKSPIPVLELIVIPPCNEIVTEIVVKSNN